MQVQVLYFGLLRRYVSDRKEIVELPEGSTMSDLVAALVERHGPELQEQLVIRENGQVSEIAPNVFIMLDGRNVETLQGLDTVLTPEVDAHFVALGPVVTGG